MYSTAFLLSLLPLALAKDIPITVGNGALRFNPESVTAAVGDTLSFTYFPKNHSVTQSSFADPCIPLAGGINSGFNPTPAGPAANKFVVTVKDTKPIWFYCAQTNGRHCQSGMSMVVNQAPPPSPATLDAYKAKAAAQTGNSTAGVGVSGGVFVPVNVTASASSTGASTASASAGLPGSTSGAGGSPPYPYSPGSSSSGSGSGTNAPAGAGGYTGPSASGVPGSGAGAPISFTGAATDGKVISSGLVFLGAAAWALSSL